MAIVTENRVQQVADKLWREVYERPFRGKSRGRFAVTRNQMMAALGVERLHAKTVRRVQDAALQRGLIIIDLDGLFPCIETKVVRKYRRPPKSVFENIFETTVVDESDDEAVDDEAEEARDED